MDVQKEVGGAKHNLAKSLQNESAEHRAKVMEFVLDWNINPNEEFFLIFAAIGHLKVLIAQAPEDIRQLFKSVLQELVAQALESTTVVLPADVLKKLDYASEQSGYATVKLQRIEKALGIKKKPE